MTKICTITTPHSAWKCEQWPEGGTCANTIVECDSECGAKDNPETLAELIAAYSHWRSHRYMSGCSHAN